MKEAYLRGIFRSQSKIWYGTFPKTVYGFKLFIVFKKKLYLRCLTDASVSLRAADVPSYSAINLYSNIYNDYSKMRKPLQMTMSLNIHQYSHISSFIHPSLDIIYRFFLDSSECRLWYNHIPPAKFDVAVEVLTKVKRFCFFLYWHVYFLAFINLLLISINYIFTNIH